MTAHRQKKYRSEIFRQELLKQIFSGELKFGDRIASYRELSKKYKLSYMTVNNVIKGLCRDGYLDAKQGVGTTVKHADPSGEISRKSRRIIIYEPILSEKIWSRFVAASDRLPNFYPKFVLRYGGLLQPESINLLPDLIYTSDDLAQVMARRNLLQPLDNLIKDCQIDLGRYCPSLLEQLSLDGVLYGLPFCFSTLALFYNKDIFDRCGVKYPDSSWTWREFREAAGRMTIRDRHGKVINYGFIPYFTKSTIFNFYMQGIPPEYDINRNILPHQHVDGLKFIMDLVSREKFAPFMQQEESYVTDIFIKGKAAMTIGKYQMVNILRQCDFRWGISEPPRGKRKYSSNTVQGFGIRKSSEDLFELGSILKMISGEKMQQIILKDFGNLPAFKDMAEKAPYSGSFLAMLPHTSIYSLNYAENEFRIYALFYQMLIELITPEEVIKEFQKMRGSVNHGCRTNNREREG